jgi:hypothetical protein
LQEQAQDSSATSGQHVSNVRRHACRVSTISIVTIQLLAAHVALESPAAEGLAQRGCVLSVPLGLLTRIWMAPPRVRSAQLVVTRHASVSLANALDARLVGILQRLVAVPLLSVSCAPPASTATPVHSRASSARLVGRMRI